MRKYPTPRKTPAYEVTATGLHVIPYDGIYRVWRENCAVTLDGWLFAGQTVYLSDDGVNKIRLIQKDQK